jgi:molybdopterin synthase catalytic subunit
MKGVRCCSRPIEHRRAVAAALDVQNQILTHHRQADQSKVVLAHRNPFALIAALRGLNLGRRGCQVNRRFPVVTCIISGDLVDLSPPETDGASGAVLTFLGVVRDTEDGRPIRGLRYTCHQRLAEKRLDELVAEASNRFGPHGLYLHHRTGFVLAGETSLLLRVSARHSSEAFQISQFYLATVKTDVPVWKEPVFADASAQL